MSFLEMLDVVNERLEERGEEPIAFAHDCREGICGSCSLMIDGVGTRACSRRRDVSGAHAELHRRRDDSHRAVARAAFPVIKDLVVDREALDRIVQAGGYISAPTGSAPDANAIPIPKQDVDDAMDAAACIGCGACVAACPNASASLFTAAKVSHLGSAAAGPTRALPPRSTHGGSDGPRGLRRLHVVRRMPGGLSEAHQHRYHRADESGLLQGLRLRARGVLRRFRQRLVAVSNEPNAERATRERGPFAARPQRRARASEA